MPFDSGQTPPATTATVLGPPVLDASKLGAIAGSTTATLNVALGNAVARANALGYPKAVFYVPACSAAAPYRFTDTLWMPDGWDVVGAGIDKSFIQNVVGSDASCVAVGVQPNLGVALTNHWQSLAGIADAGWANKRNGFRACTAGGTPANNDYAMIQLQPGSLAYGPNYDGWGTTQGFTVELLAQGYTIVAGSSTTAQPGLIPPGATFGMATEQGVASPWYVMFEGGSGTAVSGSGTALTINVPQVRFEAVPFGPGYVTFTSGALAGQTYQVASATNPTGDNYACTLSGALASPPGVGDTCVYYTGVSLHYQIASTLLNNTPGLYDPTFGGGAGVAWWRLPTVGTATIATPQRWVFQLDLTGGTSANVVQAAVSCGSPSLAAMQWLPLGGQNAALPLPNPFLVENGYIPFTVASLGPTQGVEASVPYPKTHSAPTLAGGMDWLVGGLSVTGKVAGGNVYSVGTAGAPPALNPSGPRPSGTVNDSFRYNLGGVAASAGYLACDSSGTDAFGGAYARSVTPSGPSGGWVRQDIAVAPGFGSESTVRDLTITSTGRSGNAVEIGYCVNQTVRDIRALGFANSVGNTPTASNYPHKILNLIAEFPSQAAIYGYRTTMWVDKLIDVDGKRSIVRMAGSDLTLRSAYLGATTGSVAFKQHNVDYAGAWIIEEISWDSEGAPVPPVALIDYEGNGSVYDQLTVRNCALGYVGLKAAHIRMRGGNATPVLVCIRDNTWGYHQGGPYAFATVDSDVGFAGVIENNQPTSGWSLSQAAIPLKSFAASGKSAVTCTMDLPGVTLPPSSLTTSAYGTVARNYRDATSGAVVKSVFGSDGAWHTLEQCP